MPLSFSFYGYVINWNMLKSKRKRIRFEMTPGFKPFTIRLLVPKILGRHVLVNRLFTSKNRST